MSREFASRISASRTGWRDTPNLVAMSCSERREPGFSSSSMMARRRSFSIAAAALSPLSAVCISRVILHLAGAIDGIVNAPYGTIQFHTGHVETCLTVSGGVGSARHYDGYPVTLSGQFRRAEP